MFRLRAALAAFALPLLSGLPAYAAFFGSSSATGVSAQVNVLPILGSALRANAGPLPVVSGTAPAPYNATSNVLAANVGFGLLVPGSLKTTLLTVNAASNIPNTDSTTANATVNGASLGLAALVGLTADVITSSATTGGTCGSLTATGTTTLAGARLNGLTLAANPAPNTVILNAGGIEVILNEQIVTGNGITSTGLTVNAIHIIVTNAPLGLGVLGADVVISQSKASLQCAHGSADLLLQKESTTKTLHIGDTVSYRIYTSDLGPDPASGVVVTDNLPSGVTFVSATTSQGSCSGTTTVICDLGTLPLGVQPRIEIIASVQGPNVSNTATVKGNEDDPNLANNTATTSPAFGH